MLRKIKEYIYEMLIGFLWPFELYTKAFLISLFLLLLLKMLMHW